MIPIQMSNLASPQPDPTGGDYSAGKWLCEFAIGQRRGVTPESN